MVSSDPFQRHLERHGESLVASWYGGTRNTRLETPSPTAVLASITQLVGCSTEDVVSAVARLRKMAIAEAYARGDKVAAVAAEHGIAPGHVTNIAREMGCPPRPGSRGGRPRRRETVQ